MRRARRKDPSNSKGRSMQTGITLGLLGLFASWSVILNAVLDRRNAWNVGRLEWEHRHSSVAAGRWRTDIATNPLDHSNQNGVQHYHTLTNTPHSD